MHCAVAGAQAWVAEDHGFVVSIFSMGLYATNMAQHSLFVLWPERLRTRFCGLDIRAGDALVIVIPFVSKDMFAPPSSKMNILLPSNGIDGRSDF